MSTSKSKSKPEAGPPAPSPALDPAEVDVSNRPAPRVGVLGAGAWGTTLAHLAAQATGSARLWCRRGEVCREIAETGKNAGYTGDVPLHAGLEPLADLKATVADADLIIVAVPSKGFRQVIVEIGGHVRGDQMVVSATKGFEVRTFTRMSEIVRQETCIRKIGVLSGPNLAAEIMDGQPTATVIASRFDEVFEASARGLMSKRFRVYGSHDVLGVELGGALKNVFAITAGFCDGLGFGANTKAALVTRGLAEMTRIATRLGGDPLTMLGLAGVGDLVVTCSSELSRNYRVGFHLAKGETLRSILKSRVTVAEGIRTAEAVTTHAREIGIDMPITEGVHRVLKGEVEPTAVLEELMGRPPRRREVDVLDASSPSRPVVGSS